MSIHGICFDNSQSGNCNIECEQFLDGYCPEADTVYSEFAFYLSDEEKESFKKLYNSRI